MTDDQWAHERTLVLAENADLADLDRYASGRGWPRTADTPPGYATMRQVGWENGDTSALWMESGRYGVRFVCVAGPSGTDVAATAEALAGVLPVVTEDAMLAVLTADDPAEPAEALRALHRLATQYLVRRLRGMPTTPDDRYRTMAERTVAHPDLTVRHALLMLFADLMTERPEVVPPILAYDADGGELADLAGAFAAIAAEKGIPVA